jgi:hypothetical protein
MLTLAGDAAMAGDLRLAGASGEPLGREQLASV